MTKLWRVLPAGLRCGPCGWLFFAAPVLAAGGHFDVDDAAVLEPGHCQYETWLARAPSSTSSGNLVHLGPSCRVGAIEVGINLDHLSAAGDERNFVGPQLKWVLVPLAGPVSAGLAWNASFDTSRGGRPSQGVEVPVTWTLNERWAFNFNLGADRSVAGENTRRLGASGEWAANEKLTLIAERVQFTREWTSRLGARFFITPSISVDMSAARVGPNATRFYVIGLNHDFAR